MQTAIDKRNTAKRLMEARLDRTPRQQLKLLGSRPGGAARERARLQKMIDAGNGDKKGLRQYKVPA